MSKQMNTALGLFMGVVLLVSLVEMARVFAVLPTKIPPAGIMTLHVLPLLVFALIHGAMAYRLRGILIFCAICLVLGNIFDNLGVATGFPFGGYYFTDAMGPKLFHVPVLMGLAEIGMGYLSWMLGGVILGDLRSALARGRVVTRPLLAAFIMLVWDLANDPVWAHIDRLWVWKDGGAYFGVPLTNFAGLFFVYYLIHQSFAIYVRGCDSLTAPLPIGYWRLGVIFYALCALGGIIFVLSKRTNGVVLDATGRAWNVNVFTTVSALVCFFVMGGFAVIAWRKILPANRGNTESQGF